MFVTFEGIDGAGKSTHLLLASAFLRRQGVCVTNTREPGGSAVGEALRPLFLSHAMRPETEALLMFAARAEHLIRVIEPALAAGQWVLSDRFTDASFAYQGAQGVSFEKLQQLEAWVHPHRQPDLTLLFDLSPELAWQRIMQRCGQSFHGKKDKFEHNDQDFFIRVRNIYLQRAARFPARFRVIDAAKSLENIQQNVQRHLQSYIL